MLKDYGRHYTQGRRKAECFFSQNYENQIIFFEKDYNKIPKGIKPNKNHYCFLKSQPQQQRQKGWGWGADHSFTKWLRIKVQVVLGRMIVPLCHIAQISEWKHITLQGSKWKCIVTNSHDNSCLRKWNCSFRKMSKVSESF